MLPPDEPNDEEREEELPEDNGTPFQPADDTNEPVGTRDDSGIATPAGSNPIPSSSDGSVGSTYPTTDAEVDEQENYDEGLSGATETSEPNVDDTVLGYTPEEDKRAADNHR